MRTPTIIEGLGCLTDLPSLLDRYQARRPLLVTGGTSYSNSGAQAVLEETFKGVPILHYSGFSLNPKLEDAERGAAIARDAHADLIVAVGGGSVIDMAKLMKALYCTPNDAVALIKGDRKLIDSKIPLIAVPTTAGSGSEATHFAVVYIGFEKYSLGAPFLLPEGAVLDGTLLRSCTLYQRTCSGLDALAQAVESAWAISSTEQSRTYAFKAVEGLMRHLPNVVSRDAELSTLQKMLVSANQAGQAINISKTTAAHAWSYGWTSRYNIPHGHAVWLTLPSIVSIHASPQAIVIDGSGVQHLRRVMRRLLQLLKVEAAEDPYGALTTFLHDLGIETDMNRLGADTLEKRRFLSQQINTQRMSNNPVELDGRSIKKIFDL